MMRGMKNFTEEQKSMNAQLEQLYPWYQPNKRPNKSNVMSIHKQASRELTRLNSMVRKMEDAVQQADRFSERRTNELFDQLVDNCPVANKCWGPRLYGNGICGTTVCRYGARKTYELGDFTEEMYKIMEGDEVISACEVMSEYSNTELPYLTLMRDILQKYTNWVGEYVDRLGPEIRAERLAAMQSKYETLDEWLNSLNDELEKYGELMVKCERLG